jgi:hypothetical protein
MNIELPLYAQERPNTCALACLRMVLAAYGTHLDESAIEAVATMEDEGAPIEESNGLRGDSASLQKYKKPRSPIYGVFSGKVDCPSPSSTVPSSTWLRASD